QRNTIELRHELGGYAGLALESVDHLLQGVDELVGAQIARLQALDQLAEAHDLLFQKAVKPLELACHARRFFDGLGAQRSQLNLHAHHRLDDAIVEFARNSRTLDGRGARAQPHEPVVTASHESLRIVKGMWPDGASFRPPRREVGARVTRLRAILLGNSCRMRTPARTSAESRLCRAVTDFVDQR